MTAAILALLAEQPKPKLSERSILVYPRLLEHTSDPFLHELIRRRRDQGVERHGEDLYSHNGRRPRADAIQELIDAAFYLQQWDIEGSDRSVEIRRVLKLIRDISPEYRIAG